MSVRSSPGTGDGWAEVAEQVPLETAADGTSRSAEVPETATLIVIRHGERLDDIDPSWSEQSSTPWDPPLSQHGREQVSQAAQRLAGYAVQRVVTSPFIRCLETAAVLMESLELPWQQCEVDCRFGEVMDGTILARGAEVKPPAGVPPAEWFWKGRSISDAMLQNLPPAAASKVALAHCQLPSYPETISSADRRYRSALTDVALSASQAPTTSAPSISSHAATLIVTHGECVRAALAQAHPSWLVYEVLHCGFVVANLRQKKALQPSPSHDSCIPEQGDSPCQPSSPRLQSNDDAHSPSPLKVNVAGDRSSSDSDVLSPLSAEDMRSPQSLSASDSEIIWELMDSQGVAWLVES